MISYERRIKAFAKLGEWMRCQDINTPDHLDNPFVQLINQGKLTNPWFTPENVLKALITIGECLTENNLNHWLDRYREKLINTKSIKRVGVVMAGNIPLVGFHDFLCVVVSGNKIIARLSSEDNQLLPAIAKELNEIDPGLSEQIIFTEEKLENYDAVIATGSNNTSRYFEYYFRHVPHIIRKNRNGVAVLTGNESDEELTLLGEDIFLYFGLGCRSVSKLFVPRNYSFDRLFHLLEKYHGVGDHNKYNNNYEYYKSIYLINGLKHFDSGFLLLKHDSAFASPPAVLFYEEYDNLELLNAQLQAAHDQIQCIVGHSKEIAGSIPFGGAQKPELWDYADGVDTMDFLLNL
jgi:hypothetical protein